MTYTEGQEIYHPAYGTMQLVDWNDAGQLFCVDGNDMFYLINDDEDGLVFLAEGEPSEDLTEEQCEAEQINRLIIHWALDPECRGIILMVDEKGILNVRGKNLDWEETFNVIQATYHAINRGNNTESVDLN